MNSVLIVCIGNDLVADDGVGHRIFLQLSREEMPTGVRLLFLGLGGIDLIECLDGEKLLVVVDAVQLGAEAGTVHLIDWQGLPRMASRPVSGHGIGVCEALQVCKSLYPERMPDAAWMVGVEGVCFDQLGVGLTPVVEKSVVEACDVVLRLLQPFHI